MKFAMKRMMLVFGLALSVIGIFAQEVEQTDAKKARKLSREEKLAQRKTEEEVQAKAVEWMVNHRQFVLEAHTLSNKRGDRMNVSNRINFIAVDSNKITIQLASISGIGGTNGMGGVTTDGRISKYDLSKFGKSGTGYSIRVQAMTSLGSYDLIFTVSRLGNADAVVSGATTGGRLEYHGFLVPKMLSKVFKGSAI
jgi:hypothetical protein